MDFHYIMAKDFFIRADDLFFDLEQGQRLAVDIDAVYFQHLVGDDSPQAFGAEFEFQAQSLTAEYGIADIAKDAGIVPVEHGDLPGADRGDKSA